MTLLLNSVSSNSKASKFQRSGMLVWRGVMPVIVLALVTFSAQCYGEEVDKKAATDYDIPLVEFKGEPFFPVSTFDQPAAGGSDRKQWVEAGANTALMHVGVDKLTESNIEEMQQKIRNFLKRCEEEELAAIFFPVKVNGEKLYRSAYDSEFRKKVKRFLNAMLDVTAGHPQVLGYWAYDEPENHLWGWWEKNRDWEGDKQEAFADWTVENLGWFVDLLRARHPDAYVMPTIAWWNMYEQLAPLVDIHVPNEYPTLEGEDPLTGSLYDVVYDAAKAAEAVRKTDVHSFIYMPGIFNHIGGKWRAPSLEEMRYVWFAPLTQGARGIMGWRLSRCKPPYRQEVLYTIMKEVTQFKQWWLAPALNDRVTSDRDTASVDYLKEFPELIRTVTGENIERREVQGLPDVSYTLRMIREQGVEQYLLLAVNNRKAETPVNFTFRDFENTDFKVHEALTNETLKLNNGQLKDELAPFGVRVYRFDLDSSQN